MSNTVELHRVLKSTPDRIYRAFTSAGAFAKWLPPYGFFGTVLEMDSRREYTLVREADGMARPLENHLGDVRTQDTKPRRRHSYFADRRPRFLVRRTTGKLVLVPPGANE